MVALEEKAQNTVILWFLRHRNGNACTAHLLNMSLVLFLENLISLYIMTCYLTALCFSSLPSLSSFSMACINELVASSCCSLLEQIHVYKKM